MEEKEKKQYLSEDGCTYSSVKDYIWTGIFNFCGCYSQSLYDLMFKILSELHSAKKNDEAWYYDYEGKSEAETDIQELILHILDAHDLTEHGSAVRGCWLTDSGIKLCELIEANQ